MRGQRLIVILLFQTLLLTRPADAAQRILLASSHKGDTIHPVSRLAAQPSNNTKDVPPPAVPASRTPSVVISVAEQKLYLFDSDGQKITSYRVSTSKFGLGDSRASYATPTGQFSIAGKIGAGAESGTVFRHCRPTREICVPNAPGRDPIVTRILTLRGLENENRQALARGIYIHGTPDERHIGRPASYGCIRMKSRDVIELFDRIRTGTIVEITPRRVGGLFASATRTPQDSGSQ